MQVLALAEHRAGEVEPITQQLLRQGRDLARGGSLSLLVLAGPGSGIAGRLEQAGADRLLSFEDEALSTYNPEAYCRFVEALVRELRPDVLLCGHTFQGMEVAPWVAARLGAPLASNCVAVCAEGDAIVAERLMYGGAWQVKTKLSAASTVVVTVARKGASMPAAPAQARIDSLDATPHVSSLSTEVVASIQPQAGEGDITQADLVVGVGRGIKDPANLAMMQELADALGGVLACSRPLVDLEWMPHESQVGASGREISSKVYLACGISGAAQHLAGIGGVETVIAINKDASAPIFGLSHFGVAGDLFEIVPALIAEARRRRATASESH